MNYLKLALLAVGIAFAATAAIAQGPQITGNLGCFVNVGINCPGFIPTSGTGLTNGINLQAANSIGFYTNSTIRFTISSTGNILSANNGVMIAGAATSATVPMFVPNKNSTNTGFGAQASGNISATVAGAETQRWTGTATTQIVGQIVTVGTTVGALPAGITGGRMHVTDQLTTCPVIGAALTGGGAVTCPVFYNGAAWVGG